MKKILSLILFLSFSLLVTSSTKQETDCVSVGEVYASGKIKKVGTRSVIFGTKQILSEQLQEKFDMCDEGGKPVNLEIYQIGNPVVKYNIGGVGETMDKTEVKIKIHFDGNTYEGVGVSNTKVFNVMIELKDDKLPFSQTVLSNAIKMAIEDAFSKM